MNILDIDLDFFLDGRENFATDSGDVRADRLNPWEKERVINFIENELRLSTEIKVPGCGVTSHHEVYFELKKLIEGSHLTTPFDVYHIDAHADMGLGDSSWGKKGRYPLLGLPMGLKCNARSAIPSNQPINKNIGSTRQIFLNISAHNL